MEKDKLLYTLLKTPVSHYIYDSNINKIESISQGLYNYLFSNTASQNVEILNEIKYLQEKGLLLPCELEDVEETISDAMIEYYLNNKLKMLSKNKLKGKPLTFSITTNASLLTESIMEYFVANDVNVLVSLDGPKEIHDYNRKNCFDGAGTFDLVFSNLKRLLSNSTFKNYISINAVINPSYSFEKYNDFFNLSDFENVTIYSPIVSLPKERSPLFSKQFFNSMKFDKYLHMINMTEHKEIAKFSISAPYKESLRNVYEVLKTKTTLPKKRNHSGPCMPGVNFSH